MKILKGLPPALKKRKRYIAFRLIRESDIKSENQKCSTDSRNDVELEERSVAIAIMYNMISLFGDYYSASSGLWLEEFNDGYGILRCNNEELDKVKVALTLTSKINGMSVIPVILGVSGTIKKCRSKYIGGVKNAHATDGL